MKKIINNKYKFIIGIIVGAIVSGICVTATTLDFTSNEVEHVKSDGTTTTVKNALNDLNLIASKGTATRGDIKEGKSGLAGGTLQSGEMVDNGFVTLDFESGETKTLSEGYYSGVTLIAPVSATQMYSNVYQKTISKKGQGASNGSGTLTWTAPYTGYLTYEIKNGNYCWDYADESFGGCVKLTITCDIPSKSLITEGDVLTCKWNYSWYKGNSVWNSSATGKVIISLLY